MMISSNLFPRCALRWSPSERLFLTGLAMPVICVRTLLFAKTDSLLAPRSTNIIPRYYSRLCRGRPSPQLVLCFSLKLDTIDPPHYTPNAGPTRTIDVRTPRTPEDLYVLHPWRFNENSDTSRVRHGSYMAIYRTKVRCWWGGFDGHGNIEYMRRIKEILLCMVCM